MRRSRPRAGIGITAEYDPGAAHHFLGCAGSHQADGIRRIWREAAVCDPGAEEHCGTAAGSARHHQEIRWCPAHKGIASNEKADEWAKIAAEEP